MSANVSFHSTRHAEESNTELFMQCFRFVANAAHCGASGLSLCEAQHPSIAAISAAHGPEFFSFLGRTLRRARLSLGGFETPDIQESSNERKDGIVPMIRGMNTCTRFEARTLELFVGAHFINLYACYMQRLYPYIIKSPISRGNSVQQIRHVSVVSLSQHDAMK